ncbi:MAG: hypothetical protein JKX99_09800 [Robiginitomaculum sp.]|nr:hypothetical protein [Robiginitomaculum sp.]
MGNSSLQTKNWPDEELARRRTGQTKNWPNEELAKRRTGQAKNWTPD